MKHFGFAVTRIPRWAWVIGGLAAAVLAVVLLLPLGMRWAALDWLHKQGQTNAGIYDVDFNPFTGMLTVSSLVGREEEGKTLTAQTTRARVDWWPLFQRRIFLKAVTLEGAAVDVYIGAGGKIGIGRMTFGDKAKEAPQETGSGEAWGIGLDALDLRDVLVRVRDPSLVNVFKIRSLHVDPLRSWEPEVETGFSGDLEINGGQVRITGTMKPFSRNPSFSADIDVRDYRLGWIRPVIEAVGLTELSGILAVGGRISGALTSGESGKDVGHRLAAFEGTISVDNLELVRAEDGMKIDVAAFRLEGTSSFEMSGTADTAPRTTVRSDGTLHVGGLHGVLPVSKVALKPVTQEAQTHDDTAALSGRHLDVDGVFSWSELLVAISRQPPTADSSVRYAREAPATVPPVLVRAAGITMTEGMLAFQDNTVSPPVQLVLSATSAKIAPLDTGSDDVTSRFSAGAKVGEYGSISIEGQGTPILALRDGRAGVSLHRFTLPPLTGYAKRYLGYRVRSGALDLNTKLTVERGLLKAENTIEINKLELEDLDPARKSDVDTKLGLPLNVALNLLRDKDGGIRLRVPVEGDLRNPEIDMGNAIGKAVGNATLQAVQSASLSFFAPVLASFAAPVAIALAAGKLIDLANALRFDPVAFQPGSAQLDRDALAYLEKLGTLLAERPGVRITVCGLSVPADEAALQRVKVAEDKAKTVARNDPMKTPSNSVDDPDKDRKGSAAEHAAPVSGTPVVSEEELRALADARGVIVKKHLVNAAGINSDRLFLCNPEVSADVTRSPVVELSL